MGSTAAVVRANPTANFAYMNVPPAKDSAPRNQPVSQPSFIIIRAVAIGKPRVGLRMKVCGARFSVQQRHSCRCQQMSASMPTRHAEACATPCMISFASKGVSRMDRKKASDFPQELLNLFDLYVHGDIGRRDFFDSAKKFAVGGVTVASLFESLRPNYAWAEQVPKNDSRLKTGYETVPSPQGNGTIKGYLARP